MFGRLRILGIAAVLGCVMLVPRAEAAVLLSEILADPASGLMGDANGDGARDGSDDEFVELFNAGSEAVDLSGWTIYDTVALRHTFSVGTLIGPSGYFVVFGGGVPQGDFNAWQTASSGALGFNNSGDTVSVFDQDETLIDSWSYGALAGDDQSIVLESGEFTKHSALSSVGDVYSPGYPTNPEPDPVPTPEPTSFLLFSAGFVALWKAKRSPVDSLTRS